jgi:hypothetical protein
MIPMDTWQRSRVPPKLFYLSTVFLIFQHDTAIMLHTWAGFSLILYYIRRIKKPGHEMSIAYTFPLLNLTETASASSVPNTSQIPIRHVTELGLEVLLRRNGLGARQIQLHNSEHARPVSAYSNKHNKGSSTKNRIQEYGKRYRPRSAHTIQTT